MWRFFSIFDAPNGCVGFIGMKILLEDLKHIALKNITTRRTIPAFYNSHAEIERKKKLGMERMREFTLWRIFESA